MSSPPLPLSFRLALADGRRKGYIQLPDSPLFESRPGVPVLYAHGEVYKPGEDGKPDEVKYPNIVRLETTGGLTVPYAIAGDGTVCIGLRRTPRFYAPANQDGYDLALVAFQNELIETFGAQFADERPEVKVTAGEIGKWMQAKSDAGGDAWEGISPAYEVIANNLIDRLNEVGFGRWSYEAPGGYGTFGETGDVAAKRQFYARTDPHAIVEGWMSLGGIVTNRGHELHMVNLVAAKVDRSRFGQTVPGVNPDPHQGFADLDWFDAGALQVLRDHGELWCGMTEAAIGRYAALAAARPDLLPPLY